MIRKLILMVAFLICSVPVLSQNQVTIRGNIIADSLQGSSVHIINLTQKTGTVNDRTGNFQILVRENDILLFSSIEFEKKEIVITEAILKKQFLEVELFPALNILEDINLSNITLTGNINTDLENIEIVKGLPLGNAVDFMDARFKSDINDPLNAPENLAFQQNNIMQGTSVDFIAVAGLISQLIGKKKQKKEILPPGYGKPVSLEIRKLFKDDFFISSLKIKEEKIEDFLFYLDEQDINRQLFFDHHRMALIELLLDQSEKYRSITSEN